MILKPGQKLCGEGEKGDSLFIVRKGLLKIFKREGVKTFPAGEAIPGTIIGTLSLFQQKPYDRTVKAAEETEIISIDQQILQDTLDRFPAWFRNIPYFMASRLAQAEKSKSRSDKIRALPTLLFLFAESIDRTGSASFPLEPVIADLRTISGLGYNDSFQLIRALCALGLAKINPGESVGITIAMPPLMRLLYKTLLARALSDQRPAVLLSPQEQVILTAFRNAAKKEGAEFKGKTVATLKAFLAAYGNELPGIKFNTASLGNLCRFGFLRTEPEYKAETRDSIRLLYADAESVDELLELNRVYPLLDKKLPESF